jgi:hypothetical protein
VRFKKGSNRFVILFPALGIAVKFPIIHLWELIQILCWDVQKHNWKRLRHSWTKPIESIGGYSGPLFSGIIANIGEFCFYQKTYHPLLQPTYISFFGFCNIQKIGEQCTLGEIDLWCQLAEIIGDDIDNDSHHFMNPNNFCLHNGSLRMLDYGSKWSREIIARHGTKICDLFDPAYCWEDELKKTSST